MDLHERICDHENLCLAFCKAARGKQGRTEVIRFRRNLHGNLATLREGLLEGRPQIGRYRYFEVAEPKRRMICAAEFPERVLHHAIMNVCEPLFERFAIHDSYACRKGKGMHAAIRRAEGFAARNSWYFKFDIRKYFDSIDHAILLNILTRRLRDKWLVSLFSTLIDAYHTQPGKGMPIGNLISQHSANLYLGVFDHWVKDEKSVAAYLRYMDDCVLFSHDKGWLLAFRDELSGYLEEKLHLQLHPKKIFNRTSQGVPFLGMRVVPGRIRLSSNSRKRFVSQSKLFAKRYEDGQWSEAELARHMASLVGSVRIADCRGFRNKVILRYGSMEERLEPGESRRQLEQQAVERADCQP